MSAKRVKPLSVADYLKIVIDASGKANTEIAQDIGYDRPNIIAMFKANQTKLPINKVGPLARSLGIDAAYLLRMVLNEYSKETWDAINEIIGSRVVSANEYALVEALRVLTSNVDPPYLEMGLIDETLEGRLHEMATKLRGHQAATVRRIDEERRRRRHGRKAA